MKRKLTCTNYFIILEKKFQENTPKIQMLLFWLAQTSHIGRWYITPPPPESQLDILIYYVKHENALICKRINCDSEWGNDVLKIFSDFLYV